MWWPKWLVRHTPDMEVAHSTSAIRLSCKD